MLLALCLHPFLWRGRGLQQSGLKRKNTRLSLKIWKKPGIRYYPLANGHPNKNHPNYFREGNLEGPLGLFFQFLDFFLNVLPHMAVERDDEFTKGTGEDNPLYQLRHRVFFLSTTDRARKG